MSVFHPSSLGVTLSQMENLEPKQTRKMETGEEFAQYPIANHATCFPTEGDKNAVAPQYPITSEDAAISKAQLILYLIPVLGFFPSLWTLYRRQGSREQLAVSRLSITLASAWLLGYLLLATGAATSDLFTLRLFILDSFLTSSYFLVSVWLIIRLLQGKSKRLPGFSSFAEHKVGKYLS
jgi:hypothetical protein